MQRTLNRVIRIGFIENLIPEQRPEEGEGENH